MDREAIAELEEQARASQGQPVPHPPRPDARPRGQPDPTREGRARQAIEGEIAAVTKQITDLQAEKDELMVDKRVRRGSRRVLREVSSDPERTAAIDAEISQLEGKRQELQQRLATLQR